MATHEPMGGSDRRTMPRAEVAIWVEEHTRDALYFQRATNLSIGGVWLDGTLPHPPGTRVTLDIELPGDRPLRVEGEVVMHTSPKPGMAVRFVDLVGPRRRRLETYLARAIGSA
ncbi:MAG: PilZ domain-containing protein [Polyangiaceae bacterium]|jgi:hypothetical protein|nr:PilZ domain-containing protein [Polyangiaceae bacterium]MBK8938641.1 PilZ domain-containing protein [Polyangiaceae bacterium]